MNYKSIFKENAKLISPVYNNIDTLKSIVAYFLNEEKDSKIKSGLDALNTYLEDVNNPSNQNTIEFKLFKHVMETQSSDDLESYAREYIIDDRNSEGKVMPIVKKIVEVFTYLISQPFDKKTGLPIGMKESKIKNNRY